MIICGWVTQCEFKTSSAREEKVAVEQQNRTCLLSPIVTCEPNSQSPCICQLPYSSHHALNCRTSVHDHGVEETLLFDFLFDLLSPAELESSPLSHAIRNRRIVLHRLPWRWFGINAHTPRRCVASKHCNSRIGSCITNCACMILRSLRFDSVYWSMPATSLSFRQH